jgi:hypothetical protein
VGRELRTVLRDLPEPVELWAGGPGAASYAGLLSKRGLTLADFDGYLLQLARVGGRAN